CLFIFYCHAASRALLSFPTRRSSDLPPPGCASSCPRRSRGHRRHRTDPAVPARPSRPECPSRRRTARTWRTCPPAAAWPHSSPRSEEHTSELQSRENLVCRLLLEKKK